MDKMMALWLVCYLVVPLVDHWVDELVCSTVGMMVD